MNAGAEQEQQPPSRGRTGAGERIESGSLRRRERVPAAGRANRQRRGDPEACEDDDELHEVHPRAAQESARDEVRDRHERAQGASRQQRKAGDDVEDRGDAEELGGQDGERAEPDERGDQPAHPAAVAALQEIADREIAVGRRLPPHARPDPERQHERADPGRSVPPPGAQPFGVSERRGADGGARADVGREKRREQEPGAQASSGDEELAGARAPADPQPERDEEDRIGDEDRERDRQFSGPGSSGPGYLRSRAAG